LTVAVAVMHPAEFGDGHEFTQDNPAPEGQGWLLEALGYDADNLLRVHPANLIDAECRLAWSLYKDYAGGGLGAGHLPQAGGALDQACCTMAALAVIAQAVDLLKPE